MWTIPVICSPLHGQDTEDEAPRDLATSPLLPSEIAPEKTDATAAKLIDLHLQARGGAAAISALSGIEYSGTLKEGKSIYDFDVHYHDGKVRIAQEYEHLGRIYTSIRVLNGEEGWSQKLSPKKEKAKAMKGGDTQAIKWDMVTMSSVYRHLLNWREKGHVFAFEGKENYRGKPIYLVKAKLSDGPIVFYYFDQKNFLLRAMGFRQKFAGGETNVDWVPLKMERLSGVLVETEFEWQVDGNAYRTITYDRIAPIHSPDMSLYKMPRYKEILLKQ